MWVLVFLFHYFKFANYRKAHLKTKKIKKQEIDFICLIELTPKKKESTFPVINLQFLLFKDLNRKRDSGGFCEHGNGARWPERRLSESNSELGAPSCDSLHSVGGNMSLKASYSSENLMLPVSDPPIDEDREWLLKDHRGTGGAKNTRGSSYAITKRGAYAALSYMSCAGALLFPNFRI